MCLKRRECEVHLKVSKSRTNLRILIWRITSWNRRSLLFLVMTSRFCISIAKSFILLCKMCLFNFIFFSIWMIILFIIFLIFLIFCFIYSQSFFIYFISFLIIKNFSFNLFFIFEFNFINCLLILFFIIINRLFILFFIWRNWFTTKFCWSRFCCCICLFCKSFDWLKIKRLWFTNSKTN
jgi:hypothetical protein